MSGDEVKKTAGRRRRRGRRRYAASRPLSRALYLAQEAAEQQAALMDPTGRPRFRPPRAAMAVLKRARETAAAAAQAAADAAAIIEQSRAERQIPFDEPRGFGRPPPFRRFRRGRRRGRGGRTNETSEQTGTSKPEEERPKKKRPPRKKISLWAHKQERMARRRGLSVVDPFLYAQPPGEPYPFAPEPYPPVVDDYPGMMGYPGYEWQDLGAGPDPGFIPPDRFAGPGSARYAPSRNDEYLAQARALIQAQNEQLNPGYRVPYEPWSCPAPYMPGEDWGPRSHLRSSRW